MGGLYFAVKQIRQQEIASVVQIRTHGPWRDVLSQLFRAEIVVDFADKILPFDIESFFLRTIEKSQVETEVIGFIGGEGGLQGGKDGLIGVDFLPVEIYTQTFGAVDSAISLFARYGDQMIGIAGVIAEEPKAPAGIGLVIQQELQVGEIGVVMSFGLQFTDEVSIRMVAQAGQVGEFLVFRRSFEVGAASQQAGIHTAAKGDRGFVFHIQYRRHLITVGSIEAAGRKAHRRYHIGIDKTQAFLLAGTD